MTDTPDPDVAAAMLHKTIVENALEFQSARSTEEHLRLFQRCRMVVEYWKSDTLAVIDRGIANLRKKHNDVEEVA